MAFQLKIYKIIYTAFLLLPIVAFAQNTEQVYRDNIQTIQLFAYGNQQGLPVYTIEANNKLELDFDDMEGGYKSYYYTYVLCDYNWQPLNLSTFDFMKGFTQNRITTYRYSNLAFTKYTHYQALLPDQTSYPIKSGNYLLKVFLDGDTSKVVFTKKMVVLEQKAIVQASVVQPFTADYFYTHQRIKINVNIKDINSFSAAQQIKVVVLQNNRWENAQKNITPTFVRGNLLEYNTENIGLFPGGKEWRWLDIRSFRMTSDRIESGLFNKDQQEFYLKTDFNRESEQYMYFPDYNGMYNICTYESINPLWQADYATIHFFFSDKLNQLNNKDLYLAGQFTNFELNDQWKMKYNDNSNKYECSAYLKQGYYNFTYIAVDKKDPSIRMDLEGNNFDTENTYTVLVYYKSFTDRNDRLIGVSTINSRRDRAGFGF
jgi:hypothetical protein